MPSPTSEQEAILAAATATTANLSINALAGTGKSTTLRMIERAVKARPILYLAFNKSVVTEIEYKARAADTDRRMSSTTTVRTMNGLGHRIWAQTQKTKNVTLNAKKVPDILRGVIDEVPKKSQAPLWDAFWNVVAGVATAKALGYVPEGKFENAKRLCNQATFHAALDEAPDDLTADLIDLVLTRSITAAYAGSIDFNDQVYMPACFGGIYPQFPLVMVDEAQDLNPVNHEMLARLVKHRTIIVGDPWQSIYGFRGAVQSGMSALADKFSTLPLDLSISFRCPQAIVENARWRVPHYKWMKEGGNVEHLKELQANHFADNATILCRNNAPLFRLAMQLLATGRSVQVAGSDIGPKLVATMRKIGPEDLSRASVLSAIDDWLAEKIDKGSTTASDLAECMRVFASHGETLGQAILYAEHLFKQSGTIRLMTGHKAKGLEFPTVYHLDSHLCRETEQDMNLRYVIDTRAQERLYYIDSAAIKW